MRNIDKYTQLIKQRGNTALAESIFNNAEIIGSKYLQTFSFGTHEMGLLFGNVQSGKTGQMFGVLAKATDLGFSVFVILTTDNVTLQQQTLDRVKEDLPDYCICGENDSGLFIQNRLIEPAIIVLKKNTRVLNLWANVFASTGFMKGNPLFIIDDEADAASLNNLVNKGQRSTINSHLEKIILQSASSVYLQVTGTPQAIFLQTSQSGWRPYFTHYFEPGEAYLGGDFFFPMIRIPKCIEFIEKYKNPILEATLHFLVSASQTKLNGGSVCNFLIHPSVRKAVHNQYNQMVVDALKYIAQNLSSDELINKLHEVYSELIPARLQRVEFSEVLDCVQKLVLNDEIKILVMNTSRRVTNEEYSAGYNIIIGGNTLGRGVTFPGLNTILYTRTARRPQADTMWQHSRMFGYDRDKGLMKVFLDETLYKLFSDINATNNSIISQIQNGFENITVYYSENLKPTRKTVIDERCVSVITGGTNYFPMSPINDSIEAISQLLSAFSDDEKFYQVSLRLFKEILKHITSKDDFRIDSFTGIIDTHLAKKPTAQGVLIVRRDRNIAQGTGALLSPNDWQLGASFASEFVLTMYQVTGNKGWDGQKIWVPNIKLPSGSVYYDVLSIEE